MGWWVAPRWMTVVWAGLLIALHPHAQTHARVFTLGYLTGSKRLPHDQEYKRPGLLISGAISLAVEEVNSLHPLVNGHKLNFSVAETYGREEESILQTAKLWISNISAYIGPQETCVHEARMAAAFNLPMISYFCTHPETSDKNNFPTFARTRPPDTQISKSVTSILKTYNWRKVTFLYNNSPDENFGKVAKTIVNTLPRHNITILATKSWDATYHHGYDKNPFVSLLQETYLDCRIYVVLGQYYEFLGLLTIMEEYGLFDKGEYFVVGVSLSKYDKNRPEKYLRDLLNEHTNSTVQAAFQNFLGVVPSPAPLFERFTSNVNEYLEKPPFNHPNALQQIGGMKNIRAEAAYLYDAVHVYARALNNSLMAGTDPHNGTDIITSILGTTYRSAMGYMVRMDEKGDAEGNYTLIGRQRHHNLVGENGLYPVGGFRYVEEDNKGLPVLHLTSNIQWKNSDPPIDEPICGFRGQKCQSKTGEIIAGVTGGVVVLLLLVSLVAYRNWRYEQELDSLLWKIDYRDIKINDWSPNHNPVQNKISRSHQKPLGLYSTVRTSQLSLNSNPDLDFRYASVYTQLGIYKGRVVAVKPLSNKAIDVTRRVKKELKTMRDLRHDNLLGFIGACVDPPNVCIVTEYCSRGSLKDILENEDVKLDNMFIASLVGDIVQGMVYLHDSPVKSHGNLKTSNCLVDSRWVVKITDFGLHALKSGTETDDQAEPGESNRKCIDLLYRSPELLRDNSAPPAGTQKGDVYSFALILYEVHGRHGPWGPTDQSPFSLVRQVMAGPQHGTSPLRPPLSSLENCLDCVRSVITECWAEIPEERPDFRAIRTKLRPLKKGMKPNIFDNMLAMMEKYANNLEVLVDERTDQLNEEKKKTEALLYEMLPRYVAEQLKRGHKVEAENFDCVTIYFSDIVGFTEMSAESTPLQVVDFLNDLYTCFDSIIMNYDVYKVETIGDAYMVVSGLPIRNEDQHAGEVASMSLHLLDAIKRFKIRHRPLDTLKLRIGLHSGPVCAGVVGLKMPRYCLFGDTVNTASRMESTGQALRIHCSWSSCNILTKVGGYYLEERGQVKVKGKGEMTTYWLVGEDPERKRHREEFRRNRFLQGELQMKRNGCVGGLRASLRSGKSNKDAAISRTVSLESPKRLRFAMSEELTTQCDDEETDKRSPPPQPSSPASDDFAMRRISNLDVKRNSCPCIKEHQRAQHQKRRTASTSTSKGHTRDSSPLLFHPDFPTSPISSPGISGDEEVLTASRRTSVSEVGSRPSSYVENPEDHPPSTTGEPPPPSVTIDSPPTYERIFSIGVTHDALRRNSKITPLVGSSTSTSSVNTRLVSPTSSVAPTGTTARYCITNSGGSSGTSGTNSRWRPHGVVPLGRRGSGAGSGESLLGGATNTAPEVSEGRTPRLRYCSKQDVCDPNADCEESSPLLASVVNYKVINEVHKLPERETPV